MKNTRDYGSGSISEKAPGVWVLRVSAGTDPITGEARRINRTFRGTKKQAQAELAALVADHNRNGEPTAMTVHDVVRRYLDTSFLKPGTADNYARAWAAVPHHFRTRKAAAIDCDDISALYRHVHDEGFLTAQYVRQLHIMLNAAFNRQRRHLPTNPCAGARRPPVQKKTIELPPEEAVRRLFDLVADRTETLLWLRILVVTGCRRGESLAIRWSDVDLATNTLRISDQIDRDGRHVPTTKSEKERSVHLDADTVALLLEWRHEQAETAAAAGVTMCDDPWVFSRDKAGNVPKRGDSMYQRFKRYARAAGIPDARPHHMRHYMVSHAIDNGIAPHVVSKIVGHSSVTFTLNIYAKTVTGADRMAVEKHAATVPVPDRANRRSPFDNPALLRSAAHGAPSRAAVLTRLGVATAAKNYRRLEQSAQAFGISLPAKQVA